MARWCGCPVPTLASSIRSEEIRRSGKNAHEMLFNKHLQSAEIQNTVCTFVFEHMGVEAGGGTSYWVTETPNED